MKIMNERMEGMDTNSKEIRAVYTDTTIRVYQAYNKQIAEEAVKKGTFGNSFRMNRMTWIKPSFLWMMYRCGWGEKENQERILAIDIDRKGFDKTVNSAVISTYSEDMGISMEAWKDAVHRSDVRVQWDPEKDIHGNNLPYRSIQIGLRGQALHEYVNDWIVALNDITPFVQELNTRRKNGEDIRDMLPKEERYILSV